MIEPMEERNQGSPLFRVRVRTSKERRDTGAGAKERPKRAVRTAGAAREKEKREVWNLRELERLEKEALLRSRGKKSNHTVTPLSEEEERSYRKKARLLILNNNHLLNRGIKKIMKQKAFYGLKRKILQESES